MKEKNKWIELMENVQIGRFEFKHWNIQYLPIECGEDWIENTSPPDEIFEDGGFVNEEDYGSYKYYNPFTYDTLFIRQRYIYNKLVKEYLIPETQAINIIAYYTNKTGLYEQELQKYFQHDICLNNQIKSMATSKNIIDLNEEEYEIATVLRKLLNDPDKYYSIYTEEEIIQILRNKTDYGITRPSFNMTDDYNCHSFIEEEPKMPKSCLLK